MVYGIKYFRAYGIEFMKTSEEKNLIDKCKQQRHQTMTALVTECQL